MTKSIKMISVKGRILFTQQISTLSHSGVISLHSPWRFILAYMVVFDLIINTVVEHVRHYYFVLIIVGIIL